MDTETAYNRMCRYTAMAERCSSDVRKKLKSLQIAPAECERIITRMKGEGYIDDGRYASAYARDKFRFNGYGPIRIRQELKLREIDSPSIDRAISELNDLDPAEDSVAQKLQQLLRRKIASTSEDDPMKRYAKVVRWATGRGFAYDDIRRELSRLLSETPDE